MKRLLSLAGLTDNNATDIYKRKFGKWLFKHSDNVWIDGELISEGKKMAILMSTNGISPKEFVKYDGLSKGVKLTEIEFIERELYFYKKLNKAEYIKSDHRKINIYISFLENRLKFFEKHIATILSENNLLPEKYEKEFIFLLDNELNGKIRYEKDLEHWKLYILIKFFIDNGFIHVDKDPKPIKDFICNYFEYHKDNNLYADEELRKKINKYPNKFNQTNHTRNDYLSKLTLFAKNNNLKFSLFY